MINWIILILKSLNLHFSLPSYGEYMSQLIRFARVCSNVSDFNNRNQFLTAELLNKVIDIIKFVRCFLNFTARSELIVKYHIG